MPKSYPTCRLGSSIIKINDKPYHCKYCGKSFVDIPALETHKCSHKESKQYYCNICKKQFAEENSYDQHISSHSKVAQNNSISSKKNTKLHVNIQKNEDTCKKVHTCSECNKTFLTKGKMRRHRRSAHKPFGSLEVNHVCLVCNTTHKEKHEYDEHILSHSEASPTKSSMPSNRKDEIHANIQQDVDTCEKPYTCNECNKKYSFENNLKHHMQSVHKSFGTMEVNQECFVCNNTFKRKHEYDEHILSHSEASHTNPSNRKPEIHANTQHDVDTCEKPYICSECNKNFRFENNLKRHMRWAHKPSSDSMKVNHVCFVCNTIFNKKCEYDEHILAHSKVTHTNDNMHSNKKAKIHANILNNLGTCEKPYTCSECNKKYLFENNLKRHMLSAHKPSSDTTEVKHVCFVCNTSFNIKNKYDEHILSHTGTKIYICSRCRKPFSSTSELNDHKCITKGEIVLPEER